MSYCSSPTSDHSQPQKADAGILMLILRIETSSNNHPAKVPESVLPADNEERLIKVGMIFSQFLLLDFSAQQDKRDGINTSNYIHINHTMTDFFQHITFSKCDMLKLGENVCEYLFISACSFFSWIIFISLSSLCALR